MLQFSWKTLLTFRINFMLGFCFCLSESARLPPDHIVFDCEYFDKQNCTTRGDCATKIEHCIYNSDEPPACYVLWSRDEITGEERIKMKGCFLNTPECKQTACVTSSEPHTNNMHFCCCKESMCNTGQKWEPTTTEATTQAPNEKTPQYTYLIYIAICPSILAILIKITGLVLNRRRKQENSNEIRINEAEVTNPSPLPSNRPIQLLELKAGGSFGDVWLGKLHNQDVAVKIFRAQEKKSWNKELEIYELPHMHHPNILEFLGHETHAEKIQPEFWLISAYQHNGSLCDYLKSHTLTYGELCKIAVSMACGLAHLHEEILGRKTEGLKPSVAHCDFKSKNVLLRSDLSACIADFGLAMIFKSGKPCGDTYAQVGTRRYMAPEVLEGAISFNHEDFERIDVYACGLVLWEMVSRCDATGPVGEYLLPFEAELGQRPTLDEVKKNVGVKKLRPQILNPWRSHEGISIICDNMEECWDDDPEARPSSSCISYRFSELEKYSTTRLLINNSTELKSKDTNNVNLDNRY